ncbi:MAG: hypothetical protein HY282_02420 [Nitrospirae bacterium]|nr:hypothetical protein [Candidatus Manganitrophaceae bacterium]
MKTNHVGLGLAAVLFLSVLGCHSGIKQVVNSAPAAVTPLPDPIAPSDPTGTPKPTGAPFFVSQLLKFHVPWPTVIEVAVDGFIMREQPQGCGDEGCYIVLSNTEAPSGQANFVIQVFPPAYKRRANKLEFEVTDVSVNPSLKGEMLASKPLRLIMIEALGPVLGGPPNPASVPGTPEFAALHDGGFFDFIGLSSQQDADAYYQAIDPTGSKKTLKLWKSVNGFNPNDDTLDDAKAVYFNGGDLGFGRSMHMKKKPNGDIAYYVSNYPTVEDARRGTNLIATVAMDHSPGPQGGSRFTKFYVYNNVGDGAIVSSADLDGNGQKFVPKLCIICHSGAAGSTGAGDVGARFLPFDLASFQYSSVGGFGRSDQEAEFKKLNAGILDTSKSAATEGLIQAWYGGASLPQPAQISDAVPAGWSGHDDLYLRVVKTSCRGCHITRNSPVDFASFTSFDAKSGSAETFACSTRNMPHAKVTYQRFWLQRLSGPGGPTDQVGLLKQAGLSGWSSSDPCPN